MTNPHRRNTVPMLSSPAVARGPDPVDPADHPLSAGRDGVVCMVARQGPAHRLEIKMRSKPDYTVAVPLRNVGKSGG